MKRLLYTWKRLNLLTKSKKKFIQFSLVSIVLTCLFVPLILGLLIEVGIYFFPFKPASIESKLQMTSNVYFDRNDQIIWASVSEDEKWRMPVHLADVSDIFKLAIIQTEDQNFWTHGGVDWIAGMRASWQLAKNGKIVSGASTITMQLVRLTHPESRGYFSKFKQICRAIHLERMKSKPWILQAYINSLPMGGNIEGVEAGARYYFGIPAKHLTISQAILLASIPQNPNYLKPDRFPDRVLKRQRRVAENLQENGIIPLTYSSDLMIPYDPLFYFNQFEARYSKHAFPKHTSIPECLSPYPKFVKPQKLKTTYLQKWKRNTSLDAEYYRAVKKQVRHFLNYASSDFNPNVGVVIIDNKSQDLLVEYGDIQFSAKNGFVNAARSQRSPGSALKPWIYLTAIQEGLICSHTYLSDSWEQQTDYSEDSYRPRNYDRGERNAVTAESALNHSLNIPAVKLLAKISPHKFAEEIKSFGLWDDQSDFKKYGLSLALGSKNVSLVGLSKAYAGLYQKAQKLDPASDSSRLLLNMMSARPLPDEPIMRTAWKTGTSNGHKDAWCFAINDNCTIGVWVGHKSGQSRNEFVGSISAKPLAASIIDSLRNLTPTPQNNHQSIIGNLDYLKSEWVCSESYLRATKFCKHLTQSPVGRDVRLSPCLMHSPKYFGQSESNIRPEIKNPQARTYLSFQEQEEILFQLDSTTIPWNEVYWFVNGAFLKKSSSVKTFNVPMEPGEYEVTCVSPTGQLANKVKFQIVKANH